MGGDGAEKSQDDVKGKLSHINILQKYEYHT